MKNFNIKNLFVIVALTLTVPVAMACPLSGGSCSGDKQNVIPPITIKGQQSTSEYTFSDYSDFYRKEPWNDERTPQTYMMKSLYDADCQFGLCLPRASKEGVSN